MKFFLFVIWVDRRHHLQTNCIIHNKNVEQDVANQYLYLHSTSHAIAKIQQYVQSYHIIIIDVVVTKEIISIFLHRDFLQSIYKFKFSFFLMNVKRNAYTSIFDMIVDVENGTKKKPFVSMDWTGKKWIWYGIEKVFFFKYCNIMTHISVIWCVVHIIKIIL